MKLSFLNSSDDDDDNDILDDVAHDSVRENRQPAPATPDFQRTRPPRRNVLVFGQDVDQETDQDINQIMEYVPANPNGAEENEDLAFSTKFEAAQIKKALGSSDAAFKLPDGCLKDVQLPDYDAVLRRETDLRTDLQLQLEKLEESLHFAETVSNSQGAVQQRLRCEREHLGYLLGLMALGDEERSARRREIEEEWAGMYPQDSL